MSLRHWGATADEIAGPVVGDDLCPSARLVATRCITVAAPPEAVFPWLRVRVDVPGGRLVESLLLAPGDGVMLRRQLRNVARHAEASVSGCG